MTNQQRAPPSEWRTPSQGWEEGATTKPKKPPVVLHQHEKGRQVKTPNTCQNPEGHDGSVNRITNTNTLTKYLYHQRKEKNSTSYSYGEIILN
jgi:hypothetical protein